MGAKGSQSGISYIKEVVWGVTPAGQFTGTNFTSEDMAFAIENKTSNNIRPDRQTTDLIQVGAECAGGFEGELQATNLDGLLPGFFMESDWTANVLKNGVFRSSYSIERANNDVSQFFLYKGMVPNILEIAIESGEPISTSVSFVGKNETLTQVTASVPVSTGPSTKPIFSAATNVAGISIDDVAVSACLIQKIDLKLDNQVEGKTGVGVLGFCDADAKSLMVTGSLVMFFQDETYYEKYLAGTAFKLDIDFIDSLGNEYKFELPNCKFDDVKAPVTGKDDDIFVEATFVAIMGSGGYTIQLTRVVAI